MKKESCHEHLMQKTQYIKFFFGFSVSFYTSEVNVQFVVLDFCGYFFKHFSKDLEPYEL